MASKLSITDEAMEFLVKKIMEVSSKQGHLSRSPSTADLEEVDGPIELASQQPNGHSSSQSQKNKDNCCV